MASQIHEYFRGSDTLLRARLAIEHAKHLVATTTKEQREAKLELLKSRVNDYVNLADSYKAKNKHKKEAQARETAKEFHEKVKRATTEPDAAIDLDPLVMACRARHKMAAEASTSTSTSASASADTCQESDENTTLVNSLLARAGMFAHATNLASNLAASHLELGEWRQAASAARQAIAWDVRNIKAHVRLARSLENLGEWQEASQAVDDAEKALREVAEEEEDDEKRNALKIPPQLVDLRARMQRQLAARIAIRIQETRAMQASMGDLGLSGDGTNAPDVDVFKGSKPAELQLPSYLEPESLQAVVEKEEITEDDMRAVQLAAFVIAARHITDAVQQPTSSAGPAQPSRTQPRSREPVALVDQDGNPVESKVVLPDDEPVLDYEWIVCALAREAPTRFARREYNKAGQREDDPPPTAASIAEAQAESIAMCTDGGTEGALAALDAMCACADEVGGRVSRLWLAWNVIVRMPLCCYYSFGVPTHASLAAIADYVHGTGLKGVVEVGAGTGYWAHLLSTHYGVDVVAFDADAGDDVLARSAGGTGPPMGTKLHHVSWFDVKRGDAATSVASHSDRALLLCWPSPPPTRDGDDMALDALNAYRGDMVFYVGEWETGGVWQFGNEVESETLGYRDPEEVVSGVGRGGDEDDGVLRVPQCATGSFPFRRQLAETFGRVEVVWIRRWPGVYDSLSVWQRLPDESNGAKESSVVDDDKAAYTVNHIDTQKLMKTSLMPSARETRLYGGKKYGVL